MMEGLERIGVDSREYILDILCYVNEQRETSIFDFRTVAFLRTFKNYISYYGKNVNKNESCISVYTKKYLLKINLCSRIYYTFISVLKCIKNLSEKFPVRLFI